MPLITPPPIGLGEECHTFTIVGRCARTGLLGIALSSSPYSVGARCPFFRAGVGAVSTQAYTDPGLGPLAINLLALGLSPEKVLKELRESDPHPEYRQIGIVDAQGRSAVFTGEIAQDHKGAITAPNMAAFGNYLNSAEVVPAMAAAFQESEDEILEERLMRALVAGRDKGGDRSGQLSAALIVYGGRSYARTDLRVDVVDLARQAQDGDAVDQLKRLHERWLPLIPYYEERPLKPMVPSWREWLSQTGQA